MRLGKHHTCIQMEDRESRDRKIPTRLSEPTLGILALHIEVSQRIIGYFNIINNHL